MKVFARVFLFPLLIAPSTTARAGQASEGTPPAPNVRMSSGILVDMGSGKVIWARHQRSSRAPASLTKIVTALLVLERANLDDHVDLTQEMLSVEGARLEAQAGQTMTVRDLLWALLLLSGNDAATALADKTSPDGTIPGFVKLMNERAKQLGATDTHFKNPHGLPERGHSSTALDLATITVSAMQNPVFAEMVATKSHDVAWPDGTVHTFENVNKLLTKYNGAIGVKTGYTTEAGRNLASAVTRDGTTLIAIVLGSPSHYNETMDLYDWAFSNLEALRSMPSKEASWIRAPTNQKQNLRGLEVTEFNPGGSGASSVPPLAAPAATLGLATLTGLWMRRRRRKIARRAMASEVPEPEPTT
jgi:serine-type D-Ala-D-Ala carboxypeptidase (penicillin-binding protein 5/6)